jgi:glycosyltransferase involved in cell wall biosynthesis
LKVIHVLNYFLPEHIAGTEVYVFSLAKHLNPLGVTSYVVIPNFSSSENASYAFEGLTVHKYAETTKSNRDLIVGNKAPSGIHQFVELIKEINPDIVHFHEISGSNGITIHHIQATKEAGFKTFMTFHLAGMTCKTGTMMRHDKNICNGVMNEKICGTCFLHARKAGFLANPLIALSILASRMNINPLKWSYSVSTALGSVQVIKDLIFNFKILEKNTDKLIVLTDWYEKVLLSNGVDISKIKKIKQGLPLKVVKHSTAITTEVENNRLPIKLIYIGRIAPQKGLNDLLEAISNFNAAEFSLFIYGHSGDMLFEKEMRRKSSAMKHVFWMGKLEQTDVIPTLQLHDILCLCSTFSEMSPLVIQEAFAAGIPVLASNVPGNAEQIEHDYNGLLFQFKDPGSLTIQLKRILNEKELLDSLVSNISTPRSFSEVAHEYLEQYHHVLKNN